MARPYTRTHLLPDLIACRELEISLRTLQRRLLEGSIEAPVGKLAKNRRGWTRAEIDLLREEADRRANQENGASA